MSAYAYASRNHIAYHLAYVGPEVRDLPPDRPTEEFSTEYMTYLFRLGEAQGKSARPWDSAPPLAHTPFVQPYQSSPASPLVESSPAKTIVAPLAAAGG
jgi:hypothetical protein